MYGHGVAIKAVDPSPTRGVSYFWNQVITTSCIGLLSSGYQATTRINGDLLFLSFAKLISLDKGDQGNNVTVREICFANDSTF